LIKIASSIIWNILDKIVLLVHHIRVLRLLSHRLWHLESATSWSSLCWISWMTLVFRVVIAYVVIHLSIYWLQNNWIWIPSLGSDVTYVWYLTLMLINLKNSRWCFATVLIISHITHDLAIYWVNTTDVASMNFSTHKFLWFSRVMELCFGSKILLRYIWGGICDLWSWSLSWRSYEIGGWI